MTTYRTEGQYTDHRRPDEVHFVKSLREDLRRRDFTMNALAMTKEGELIDLFGGKRDLADQLIRAVGNAADRFNEDAFGCCGQSVLRLSLALISRKRHLKQSVRMRNKFVMSLSND